MKGLVCAGGEATRLGELTRVSNKHLLPVGRWPMIYYPLQLLQLAGVHEVLIVTGKGHAGQMIDLLGDGRLKERGTDEPLLEVDLTYKVQTEPGGIAQVVGMARDFAAGDQLVVCLGDNIFEYSHADAIRAWSSGAQIFVKVVPDPENFGVVVYGDDGRVTDIVEKAGIVDKRYAGAAVQPRGGRALLLPAGRLRDHRRARDVLARRARDHRCEPRLRAARRADRARGRGLVGGRRQALAAPRGGRPADRRDGREQVIAGLQRLPLRRFEDERGWFMELRRDSVLPRATVQTNVSFSRRGVIRGLHYHERGQDDLFVCLQGTARVVVLDRGTGETHCEDIGDDNPVALYIPGRHAHGFEALTDLLFVYHVTEEYDPADPDEHEIAWDDPRVVDLWSQRSPILSPRDTAAAS